MKFIGEKISTFLQLDSKGVVMNWSMYCEYKNKIIFIFYQYSATIIYRCCLVQDKNFRWSQFRFLANLQHLNPNIKTGRFFLLVEKTMPENGRKYYAINDNSFIDIRLFKIRMKWDFCLSQGILKCCHPQFT